MILGGLEEKFTQTSFFDFTVVKQLWAIHHDFTYSQTTSSVDEFSSIQSVTMEFKLAIRSEF